MTTDIGVRGATLAGPVPETVRTRDTPVWRGHGADSARTANAPWRAHAPSRSRSRLPPARGLGDFGRLFAYNTTFEHLSNRSICISLVWQRYKTLPCNTIWWPWMPLAATSHDLTLMGLA